MGKSSILWATALLLAAASTTSARPAGTRNFPILRIPLAARPAALGGAYVGLAEGVGAIAWNPAGLARVEDSEALAAYMRYPEGVHAGMVGLAGGLEGGWRVGVGLRYLSYGSMPLTTAADPMGQEGATFTASDVAVTIEAAYPLTPGLAVGLGGTYISGKIESYGASAVGADVGLLLALPMEGFRLGISVRNLQVSGSSYLREDVRLPTEGRLGISCRSRSGYARVAADLIVRSGQGVGAAAGVELSTGRGMWVRAGMDDARWDLGREAEGWGSLSALSWGVGFVVDRWRLDYAIAPFGGFGTTHRVSIGSVMERRE